MRRFLAKPDNPLVDPRVAIGVRGQAAVETAIVLPLMTFMVLGIIQLTMLQQARLMTEYAAFQACRAGIVWNADKKKMEAAARVALAPTVPKSDLFPLAGSLGGSGQIRPGADGIGDVADHVEALEATDALTGLLGFPLLRIEIIHPTKGEFDSAVGIRNGMDPGPGPGPQELDFDDVGTLKNPNNPNAFDGFAGNPAYRAATRLTIRLRYMYLMRIPFADWIIQNCWFAANAPSLLALHGALGREVVGSGTAVTGGDQQATAGIEAGTASAIVDSNGKTVVSKGDYLALWAIGAARRWYMLPLVATYTMRMQSNVYRDNLD